MFDDIQSPHKEPDDLNQTPKEEAIETKASSDADINIVMDDHDKAEVLNKNEQTGNEPAKKPSDKKSLKDKIKTWWHGLSKQKKWLFVGYAALVVIVLCLAGFFIYRHFHKKPVAKAVTVVIPKQTIITNTVASRLTGLQVSKAEADLPVTGVMIENSDEARPQSGLSEAGVVFEALAEGGITRFLAIYEDNDSSSIGPVRSARPYYIDWLLPFDAGYAHVGGSPDALSEISSLNVKDLNQFYNGSYYERISQREAPHNVYTSLSNLVKLEGTKGWTSSNFTGFPRKQDDPSKDPTATSIHLNLSSSDYNVGYTYDKTNNSYLRSEGGQSQVDANTNQQLDPKVVIAIVVPESNGSLDATGAYYSDYQDVGNGKAYIFQDGNVTVGTWQKSSQAAQILFGNSTGSPQALDAGQTWITAVTSTSQVSYTP